MNLNIAVLPGDGIGVEVMNEGCKILQTIGDIFVHHLETETGLVGGAAIDDTGAPLPDRSLELCKKSDAVLLGAVGGPKWDDLEYSIRPERAIIGLRGELGLFANLRPATLYPSLTDASTLKREVIEGIDIMVLRELTGGIYFGEPKGIEEYEGGHRGVNTLVYTTPEIERIARMGFEIAMKRRKKLTSVDKANILESSELWRRVVGRVATEFPQVELNHIYVDNCAMQLVRDPKQFDVIVTGNMFGDILSDEAAMLTGSIGMLPSASIGGRVGLYEPVHGTAPDIAGQGKANPIAMINSVAMMLRYSFDLPKEAEVIEDAIAGVLEQGYRTPDIMQQGRKPVSTTEMGALIIKAIQAAD
jgi:3-isopropylmalate dehydrogenase